MTAPNSAPDANDPRRRIFIVDDHPLVREWLANLIRQQNDLVMCGEAATAGEAIRLIAASKPEVAIVDIALRDSSGIELMKDLKRIHPGLMVLVLTMHDESLYAERALRAGAKGYIMKREATGKVIEAIRRVLEGKLYLSGGMAETIVAQFVEGKRPDHRSPIEQLSDRELAVFELLGQGIGTRQIGERLCVSIKTVQAYCRRIKDKLKLQSATELIREAVRYREINGRTDRNGRDRSETSPPG